MKIGGTSNHKLISGEVGEENETNKNIQLAVLSLWSKFSFATKKIKT